MHPMALNGLNERIVLPRGDLAAWCPYLPFAFLDIARCDAEHVVSTAKADLYSFGFFVSSVAYLWITRHAQKDVHLAATIAAFPMPEHPKVPPLEIVPYAAKILEARGTREPEATAELYASGHLPEDLLKAHFLNDRIIRSAYGLSPDAPDDECLELMESLSNASPQDIVCVWGGGGEIVVNHRFTPTTKALSTERHT